MRPVVENRSIELTFKELLVLVKTKVSGVLVSWTHELFTNNFVTD